MTTTAELNPESGLVEYLTGKCNLEDAIYKDSYSDLDLLALTPDTINVHDVVGSRAFDQLLEELKEQYHLILIDTGPLLLMAEAGIIASKTDKTLMVVRWRHSRRAAVRRALDVLQSMKAEVLGVALNMVDLSKKRHHSEESVQSASYKQYYTMEPRWGWPGFGGIKNASPAPKQSSKTSGAAPAEPDQEAMEKLMKYVTKEPVD